jgi:cytochrome c oxidase cbb3-type subunit III
VPRFLVTAALLIVSSCAAGACNRKTPGGPLQNPSPPARVAVGPLPGPRHDEPQRQNPYADDRAAMGEGRMLFVRFNCSGCHGGRAGGGMGPSLRDVDWIYGSADAQIFSSIAEGRAHGMPAWGVQLNDEQVWKLVAYIKSLRTPNEIQPPT